MLLHTHAAQSGECSYYVDATQYHHANHVRFHTHFVNDTSMEHLHFLPVYVLVFYISYLVYRQLRLNIISHKVNILKFQCEPEWTKQKMPQHYQYFLPVDRPTLHLYQANICFKAKNF